MAASSITIRPSAMEIARATAAAVPAEISTKPLLGILGVVTGAGVVTLTSRMISLGLPDFRGLHGFGYDESAAWTCPGPVVIDRAAFRTVAAVGLPDASPRHGSDRASDA